ncbi:MAG: glycerophosphoryl diester phosphodiesterase membrane domain-containing protein [Gulosibacter sp.]|uniref:glycerophosphoryl diester phosphodiesterase membrane domain-containing protein n=1 Tax=Gulosibacter sp. TaxID=2817531 RepID=UPI003F8E12C1
MTDQHSPQDVPNPNYQQPAYPGGAASWDYDTASSGQQVPPSNGWTPAPKAGLIPLRPLSFGEIFGSTFKLLRTNAGVSIGAALIVQGVTALIAAGLPTIIAVWNINRISMASRADEAMILNALPGWLLLSMIPGLILSFIGSALLQVVIIQVVAKSVLGRKARLGETLRMAWSRIWPILGYFGLMFVAMLVVSAVFVGIIALAVWMAESSGVVALLIALIVVVPLSLGAVVAMIWITTKLTFTLPAIVLEKMGPIQAIRRSWGLSKRYFWRTFGIIILLQLIVQVMSQVVGSVMGFLMGFISAFVAPTGGIAEGQEGAFIAFLIVIIVVTVLLSVLVAAIGQVLITGNAAIMYTDLRMRKEGLNIHLQNAMEKYAEGQEPEKDPWLAPDLGPLPEPQPYGAPAGQPGYANTAPGYPAPGYPSGPGYSSGPGYPGPGYGSPEYGAPGYGAQGYGTPGYGAQGYGTPGYGTQEQAAPGSPAPEYGTPGYGAPGNESAAPGYTAGVPEYGSAAQQAPHPHGNQQSQPGDNQQVDPVAPSSPYGPDSSTDADTGADSSDQSTESWVNRDKWNNSGERSDESPTNNASDNNR